MSTTTKTFVFASDAENWSATPASGDVTMGHSSGSLYALLNAKNKNPGVSYWEYSGTLESLGVSAGATVTSIGYGTNNDYDWQCAQYNAGTANANRVGPFELRDAAGAVIGTFSDAQAYVSGTTGWATVNGAAIGSLELASDTVIKLRISCNLRTANTNGAVVEFKFDNIAIDIEYSIAATQLTIDSTTHGHVVGGVGLAQLHNISPGNTLHGLISASPSLIEHKTLTIGNCRHEHLSSTTELYQFMGISPHNSMHGLSGESVALSQSHNLTPQDATQEYFSEIVTLVQYHILYSNHCSHRLSSSYPTIHSHPVPTGTGTDNRVLYIDIAGWQYYIRTKT